MKNEADPSNVLQYTFRPGRYLNVDGSGEIGWGMMCACFAVSSYIALLAPHTSTWWRATQWLFFVCGALGPLLAPKIIKRLLTFPRTGYVAYRKGLVFWLTVGGAVVIGGAVSMWAARHFLGSARMAAAAVPGTFARVSNAPDSRQVLALVILIGLTIGVFALYRTWGRRKKEAPARATTDEPSGRPATGPLRCGLGLGGLLGWLFGGNLQWMTLTRLRVFLIVWGIALLLAAAIFGLIYLCELAAHDGAANLTRIETLALFVPCNAILYLMMAGAGLTEHTWKLPWCALLVFGSLAVGVFLPGNFIDGSRPLMLFLGLVWLASGLATLFSYLRHAPAPGAEDANPPAA